MDKRLVIELDDCTEFRRIQLARPRPLAHGAVVLLVGLVTAALIWMATTRADLIVVTTGRVRPAVEPDRVFSGEQFNATTGGRVVQVAYREGNLVQAGDVLVRFDTRPLDNQITKLQRRLAAVHQAISQLDRLDHLLTNQFEANLQLARSQLDQAIQQVHRASQERIVHIRLAQLNLENARERVDLTADLLQRHAASPEEMRRAQFELQQAQTRLALAQLAVDETDVQVRAKRLQTVQRQHQVQLQDLTLKQADKQAEMDQIHLDLEGLTLQHQQGVIRATVSGVIISKELKVGDVIQAGQPVVHIAPVDGYRMDVVLASQDIGDIRVGMPARIKLDAYDYQQYGTMEGKVVFVSPDSQSTESDQDTAAPLYTARLMLVSSEVGRGQRRGRVKLGMTGRVEIMTSRENLLSLLVRKIRRTISLG